MLRLASYCTHDGNYGADLQWVVKCVSSVGKAHYNIGLAQYHAGCPVYINGTCIEWIGMRGPCVQAQELL